MLCQQATNFGDFSMPSINRLIQQKMQKSQQAITFVSGGKGIAFVLCKQIIEQLQKSLSWVKD